MNQILKKSSTPKCTYFPYLTRYDSQESKQEAKIYLYNIYTFNSILSPNFDLLSIYLNFFHSPFKKNKEQASIFYVTYCKHICIHYEMLDKVKNIGIDEILNQFFAERDKRENSNEQSRVMRITRQCLAKALREVDASRDDLSNMQIKPRGKERQAEQNLIKNQQNQRIRNKYHHLQKQEIQIQKIINKSQQQRSFWLLKKKQNFKNTILYIKQNQQKIKQQELFPFQSIQQSSFIPYVKALFRNLNNIHVILHRQKVQMYINMLNYGLIVKPPYHQLQLPQKYNKQKVNQQKIGNKQIYTIKRVRQKYPILTSFKSFLKRSKNRNHFINTEIVKDLLFEMNNFREVHQLIFPQIESKKILMDQKSLKLIYEQSYLILQWSGIVGQTYSSQLCLVYSPTPQPFNYQKSPFEYSQEYEQFRLQKYYMAAEDGQDESFARSKDDRLLKQMERFQNSHAWRIISLIYLIFNTYNQKVQFFSNRCYRMIHSNQRISFANYLKANQKIIKCIQNGQITLFQALGLKQTAEFTKNNNKKGFNFTMKELMNIFDLKNNEQQQQILETSIFFHELKIRISFYNQILQILTREKQNKIKNEKKYLLIFLLGSISFLYYFCFMIAAVKNQMAPIKQNLLNPLKINQIKLLHHFDNIFGSLRKIQQKIKSMKLAKKIIQDSFQLTVKKIMPKIEKYKKIWQNLIIVYNAYEIEKAEMRIRLQKQRQLSFGQISSKKNGVIFEQLINNMNLNEQQSILCFNQCCQTLISYLSKFQQVSSKYVKQNITFHKTLIKSIVVLCNLFISIRSNNINQFDQINNLLIQKKDFNHKQAKNQDQNHQRYYQNLKNIEQRLQRKQISFQKLICFTNKH